MVSLGIDLFVLGKAHFGGVGICIWSTVEYGYEYCQFHAEICTGMAGRLEVRKL